MTGGETGSQTLRYLRRIPRDPFLSPTSDIDKQWLLRGYEDVPDTYGWNGIDVYDVKVTYDRKALDGSSYNQW